jgi:hypothetical protein
LAAVALDAGPIRWVVNDVTAEPDRVLEWTLLRTAGLFPDGVHEQRLPSDFGELGAASGATAIVVTTVLTRVGCAPADSCVIALRSDGPERGVVRLCAGKSSFSGDPH